MESEAINKATTSLSLEQMKSNFDFIKIIEEQVFAHYRKRKIIEESQAMMKAEEAIIEEEIKTSEERINRIKAKLNAIQAKMKSNEDKMKEMEATIKYNEETISVNNIEGLTYLSTISEETIDLILTDPPYIISKNSGMDKHFNNIKYYNENDIGEVKSEDEWLDYKQRHNIENDDNKENYIKYGTIYGTKYCIQTNYGEWDTNFTIEILEQFICEFYKKLRFGGTIIIFFDLWKITILKEILEKYNFKQIRFIEWIKTNPQPRNSHVNYLTNSREIALLGVKGRNPTFNSSYDNGIYMFPLQGGKNRFHPTQKNLHLFEELIKKHSNENDVVLDTFLGSGTTAIACKNTKRKFKGCELSKEYFDKILMLVNDY